MTERYIYTDKVGAGPEHPKKRWGLFSTELTPAQAQARYASDPARREDWFGIVPERPGEDRPQAYLQMSPRADGVVMHKLNPAGSVAAAYTWAAHEGPPAEQPDAGETGKVFLSKITWYSYPDEERFFDLTQSVGLVTMEFRPDGYAKEDQVTRHGFGQPSDVETREFRGVDVSANWTPVPAFGEWEAFFHPEGER